MAYAESRSGAWRARWRAPGGALKSASGFPARGDAANYGRRREAGERPGLAAIAQVSAATGVPAGAGTGSGLWCEVMDAVERVSSTTCFRAVRWSGANLADVKQFFEGVYDPADLGWKVEALGMGVLRAGKLAAVPSPRWLVNAPGSEHVRFCTEEEYRQQYETYREPGESNPQAGTPLRRDTLTTLVAKSLFGALERHGANVAALDGETFEAICGDVVDGLTAHGEIALRAVEARRSGSRAVRARRLEFHNTARHGQPARQLAGRA